jgi:hypothetical protein
LPGLTEAVFKVLFETDPPEEFWEAPDDIVTEVDEKLTVPDDEETKRVDEFVVDVG